MLLRRGLIFLVVLLLALLVTVVFVEVRGEIFRRFHEESEARNVIPEDFSKPDQEYDTITLENYLRSYKHGPHRDRYMLFNDDMIAAYVGPLPKGHPDENESPIDAKGVLRAWAMFDSKTKQYCRLNAVYEWGQLALFSCPYQGLYRAYSIETYVDGGIPRGDRIEFKHSRKFVLGWFTRSQKEQFDLLNGHNRRVDIFNLNPSSPSPDQVSTHTDRMRALEHWWLNKPFNYVDKSGYYVLPAKPVIVSDPVRLRESYYCYYWMYNLREIAREGYDGSEIVPYISNESSTADKEPWTAHIRVELLIWIAEPAAVGVKETLDADTGIQISEYSKVITKKFSESGLVPCLRKAHPSVEVLEEIAYISETDPATQLHDTPHWRAIVRVHTDRLISTLSDVTFTIASRQNTASFHCFVGDTRVFIKTRDFQFVPAQKLQPDHINLNVSNLAVPTTQKFKFDLFNVYGHGVHHVGNKWAKRYQPTSVRSDMVVIPNPCIVQEFAFSVGGSLFIAESLLMKGEQNVKKVVLPHFNPKNEFDHKDISKSPNEFLRIFDVTFTPTHVVFLMSEGYVMMHPSTASKRGIAEIPSTMKWRPDAFVKRRWCPRTASPKLSSQVVPIFGGIGTIIILQIYPTEGNVPMWVLTPSPYCLPEGAGFVKKVEEQTQGINETDIHYQEFASIVRTNQKTGLVDPPVPSRPPPPPPPDRDIFEENSFILDSSRNFVEEGEDPHFPLHLIDPASRVLENNLKDFNEAKIYVVQDVGGMDKLLTENGLYSPTEIRLVNVEFTAAEKQFAYTLLFNAAEIKQAFDDPVAPFQAIISTITITNFPYHVKLSTDKFNEEYEHLETVTPFPAVIIVRFNHYHVSHQKSRDHIEYLEHQKELLGRTVLPFDPEIHTLGTAYPSYVVNLGDVLLYTSYESRYARPLHYFSWKVLDGRVRDGANRSQDVNPVVFDDASLKFGKQGVLFDAVVTEQGMISILRRRQSRHLVQDDEVCMATNDSESHRVIMGSVLSMDGLRELKPFFRNDNIFQRATHDGEIIYGVYDVKPRSNFKSCPEGTTREDTENDPEPCIEQATQSKSGRLIPVCTVDHETHDGPCRDPGYLQDCPTPKQLNITQDPTHACIRVNKGCTTSIRHGEEEAYTPPQIIDSTKCDIVDSKVATNCLPKHAPREDIRTINMLGTSFHSYLEGSLESVRALHPEADIQNDEWKRELDICPFIHFEVYHKSIDFAEVGYQIRVTAQISYIGTDIPVEADIIVEYERTMGVVVEISTSIEEIRQLSRIVKAVDLHFHMPDYKLEQLMSVDPGEKHRIRSLKHDFEDVRAREHFHVFSLTFRPSIVNTRCQSNEFFKTVQFNVGCNQFSTIRLMSEATTLKVINWTETLDEQKGFQWHRDYNNWNLTIPKVHIYYKQLKKNIFDCSLNPSFCRIPYFHLFKNEIFTLSYRDYFAPKFEQFMTVTSRPVTANVVMYDLLGSMGFNWTLNKYKAGCFHFANFWYKKLLAGTKEINKDTFEHENVYLYFKDCFDLEHSAGSENVPLQQLLKDPFYLFNKTNSNSVKFLRNRNEIFIFRAVVMNTFYNRFTYCKQLDTFFMVRIIGIPIPRQGLKLWQYVLTILAVSAVFLIWYLIFAKFYTWTVSA